MRPQNLICSSLKKKINRNEHTSKPALGNVLGGSELVTLATFAQWWRVRWLVLGFLILARTAGLEPTTYGLEDRCSIH